MKRAQHNGKMMFLNVTESDMSAVAEYIVSHAKSGMNILLSGELGAGKTTLAKEIGKRLGVSESVESPTYILMQDFKTTHPDIRIMRHLDVYRIEDETELDTRRIRTFLSPENGIALIEWGEKFFDGDMKIEIQVTGAKREIIIE